MEDGSQPAAKPTPETRRETVRRVPPPRAPRPGPNNDLDAMRYQILVEHGLGLICTHDLQGNLITINNAAANAIGFEPEQLIGRNGRNILPASARAPFDEYLQRIRSRGIDHGFMKLVTRSGKEMTWFYRNVLYQEADGTAYVLGHAQDVTELEQAREEIRDARENLEQRVQQRTSELRDANDRLEREVEEHLHTANALSASETRHRALLEAIPDMIFRLRQDGTFLDYKPAQEMVPYAPASDFIGKTLRDTLPKDVARPAMRAIRRACQSGRVEVVEYTLPSGDHRRDYEARVLASGTEEVVAVVRDVTEQKRAEALRRSSIEKMQHQQRLESLGALAGGIAHDFNNLLMSILGYSELALSDIPADHPAAPQLEQSIKAANRASELTQQMLTFAGSGTSSKAVLDLNTIVRDAEKRIAGVISPNTRVTYSLAADLPAVRGDASHVTQVLLNLVTNASESFGEEEGTIGVLTEPVSTGPKVIAPELPLSTVGGNGYVLLKVSDAGCGMDAETRRHIFDPFFTTKFTGRGLGLAAVLGVVREHNGVLNVTTAPGKGTTIEVWLPAVGEGNQTGRSSTEADIGWRGTGTVLVVDDEPPVRDLARQMLERMGFSVLLAENGQAALRVFESHRDIAVLLLDLTMPVMGGKEALALFKRLAPSLPVVLMSGYDEPESAEMVSYGRVTFLQKPFARQKLADTIRKIMGDA